MHFCGHQEPIRVQALEIPPLVMLQSTNQFLRARVRNIAHFFDQDGINKPTTWLRTFWYPLIYPGLLRQIFPAWLAFFALAFTPGRKTIAPCSRAVKPGCDWPRRMARRRRKV